MHQVKTLQERTKELQALLATPEGRAELQSLADSYGAADDHFSPGRTSLVTYILVHERQVRMIEG